jgi:Putative DNA-binding domain
MPADPDLQHAFAIGLVTGAVPDGVTALDPAEVAQRFNVYRNNVSYSLTQALAVKFPVIARLVGADFFAQMARIFADTHRPETPILMLWGDAFPVFLAEFPPLAAYPYMADVARIEVARGRAYHAADCTPLPAAALAALGAAGGDGPVHLHPSVQVIRSAHPAFTLWHTHQPGHTPASIAGKGPENALILRDTACDVAVHGIGDGDAAMVAALEAGETLLYAAAGAVAAQPTHDPAPLLGLLFHAGALIAKNPSFPEE